MPRVKGHWHEGTRDANQPEVIVWYEQLGCSVVDLGAMGGGLPDLLIGCAGVTDLSEVKMPGGELRKSQETFNAKWRGSRAWKVSTIADVVTHVADMRRRARKL
jgi:hypothetical protein